MHCATSGDTEICPLFPVRVAINRKRPMWTIPDAKLPASRAEFTVHFQQRCHEVSQRSIEHLQQLVYDAGQCPEAVDLYQSIVKAGLTKVLNLLHQGAGMQPSEPQVHCLTALIYGQCNVDMVACAGKAIVFQGFVVLTGMVIVQFFDPNYISRGRLAGTQRMDTEEFLKSFQSMESGGLVNAISTTRGSDQNSHVYDSIDHGKTQVVIMAKGQDISPIVQAVLDELHVRERIGLYILDDPHVTVHWMHLAQALHLETLREEERRGEERRGEERKGEKRRGEKCRGEKRRGEKRGGKKHKGQKRRGQKHAQAEWTERSDQEESSLPNHPRRSKRPRVNFARFGDWSR